VSDVVIRVEQLGKLYRIGRREEHYPTLRETLVRGLVAPFRWAGQFLRGQASARGRRDATIWALREVTLDVAQGEVVGIIGRNGAGKSTLLKILSRITEPTEGCADICGRVGALLEVGTGFHPELTGRENIYLNGAILGMRKAEIERKFDEIVAFAEVEKFLDTPVKHYSSGMYVRLAFAVAAHLEPEILLVDEVLAVGDAAFQRKCLGKMGDVAHQGRTVLFVSHNMGAVAQLCPTCILLEQGRIAARGPSQKVVETYLASCAPAEEAVRLDDAARRGGDGRLRFVAAYLRNGSGERTAMHISGSATDVVLEFDCCQDLADVQFTVTLFNEAGMAVAHFDVDALGKRFAVPAGPGRVVCHIPRLPLPAGRYTLAFTAQDDHGPMDTVTNGCVFDVDIGHFFPAPYLPPPQYATVLVEHSWEVSSGTDRDA
jgi:lipopolysaccharide transport system ATP-binding protein